MSQHKHEKQTAANAESKGYVLTVILMMVHIYFLVSHLAMLAHDRMNE
jgi:hypothetical protein